ARRKVRWARWKDRLARRKDRWARRKVRWARWKYRWARRKDRLALRTGRIGVLRRDHFSSCEAAQFSDFHHALPHRIWRCGHVHRIERATPPRPHPYTPEA